MQTLPPLPRPDSVEARLERIRTQSREKYAISKEMVDVQINRRFEGYVSRTIEIGQAEAPVSEVDYFD